MIKISICLSDIPKGKITESEKNKKKYLEIIVDAKKEADAYGNTHAVYISQTKAEREQDIKRTYIGNGKEYIFNNTPQQNTSIPSQPNNVGSDDLPF